MRVCAGLCVACLDCGRLWVSQTESRSRSPSATDEPSTARCYVRRTHAHQNANRGTAITITRPAKPFIPVRFASSPPQIPKTPTFPRSQSFPLPSTVLGLVLNMAQVNNDSTISLTPDMCDYCHERPKFPYAESFSWVWRLL